MKILFGHPIHYNADGEVVGIKQLIYVEDFDMPTLVVPVQAPIVPRLIVGSEIPLNVDLIKQVEYRLRELNDEGVATYEFVSYKAAAVDL